MIQYSLNKLSQSKTAPSKVRLFKLGLNKTTKGDFYLTKDNALKIIKSYKEYGNKLSFDYNHQQLNEFASIEAGTSAGTFELELNDLGLYAVNIDWTDRAKQLIEAKEYVYTSPAFVSKIEKADNKKYIVDIINCALTNLPATYELNQLLDVASKITNIFKVSLTMDEKEVDELKCGIDQEKLEDMPVEPEAPVDEKAVEPSPEDIKGLFDRIAAIESFIEMMKEKEQEEETPVEPVEAPVEETDKLSKELMQMKEENEALRLSIVKKEKEDLVSVALSENKILPAQKELYLKLDKESLVDELSKLSPISLGRVVPEIKTEKSQTQKLSDLIVSNFNKAYRK